MNDQPGDIQPRLIELVHSSSMLMRALRSARAVEPPDWLIGAGVIRDLVWDHLHGFDGTRRPKDIDLVFFDPGSLGSDRERSVLREVTAEAPDICWDVTNQAGVHLWYPQVFGVEVQPLASSADGVATWPETATAVGDPAACRRQHPGGRPVWACRTCSGSSADATRGESPSKSTAGVWRASTLPAAGPKSRSSMRRTR